MPTIISRLKQPDEDQLRQTHIVEKLRRDENFACEGLSLDNWHICNLDVGNLTGISYISIDECILEQSNFSEIEGPEFYCTNSMFVNSTFRNASFYKADFTNVTFKKVDFNNTNLAKSGFGEVTFEDVSFDGTDLRTAIFINCNLSSVNFSLANLNGANFLRCILNDSIKNASNIFIDHKLHKN